MNSVELAAALGDSVRAKVASHTVFDWAGALLQAACRMEAVRV